MCVQRNLFIKFLSIVLLFFFLKKQPIRTFGEWSEFLSSAGKIYFYNSKTEKAQWNKPDEWDWLVTQE
jgi:hypothetical protein